MAMLFSYSGKSLLNKMAVFGSQVETNAINRLHIFISTKLQNLFFRQVETIQKLILLL